jgi:SAM-dependent methyltransferase
MSDRVAIAPSGRSSRITGGPFDGSGTAAALARRAIDAYTRPGDLVLDPACGDGTTLVEAIELGRRAIGVAAAGQGAAAAQAVVATRSRGAPGQALVMLGDALELGRGLLAELTGQVALVLTSRAGDIGGPADAVLRASLRMLAPDGQLVVLGHGRTTVTLPGRTAVAALSRAA